MKKFLIIIFSFIILPSFAEVASYGNVDVGGLARDQWKHNNFAIDNAMVCNVNGPDGFLSVRSGPGTEYKAKRKFKRLTVLVVDPHQRKGNWVYVISAYRDHDINGIRVPEKHFKITGWVHDGYLCSFLDY